MRDFVGAFRGAGLRLIVFFDGGVDDAKLDEWLSRRKRDLTNCDKVLPCADMQSRGVPQPCRTHEYAYRPAAYRAYLRRRAACPCMRTSLWRAVRTAYRGTSVPWHLRYRCYTAYSAARARPTLALTLTTDPNPNLNPNPGSNPDPNQVLQ